MIVMAGKNILDVWRDRGFACGVAVACSILIASHDRVIEAAEVLRATGFTTRRKLRSYGVDKYDLDMLRPVFAEIALKDGIAKLKEGI
jgi:hypothetical protein